MAREVQVMVWCDLCQSIDDIKVEGVELPPVAIGNAKPRIMAMCPEHKAGFFDQFAEVLSDLGLTAEQLSGASQPKVDRRQTPTGGARVNCPLTTCQKTFKNVAGVAAHLNSIHGTNFAETIGKDGHLTDTDGRKISPGAVRAHSDEEPEVKRLECDQAGCDKVFEWPEARSPEHSMAIHLSRSHGIRGQSKTSRKRIAAAEQQELKEAS